MSTEEVSLDDLVKSNKKDQKQTNNNNRKGNQKRNGGKPLGRKGGLNQKRNNGRQQGGQRGGNLRVQSRQQNNKRFIRRTGGGNNFNDRNRGGPRRDNDRDNRPRERDSEKNNGGSRSYDPFVDGIVMEIHNLYPKILEEELYNLVTRYGAVEACRIERDSKGRSMEKATVVFRDKLSYEEAKKDLHRCELEGRTISIELVNKNKTLAPERRESFDDRDDYRREPIKRRHGFKSNNGGGRNFGRRNFGKSGW